MAAFMTQKNTAEQWNHDYDSEDDLDSQIDSSGAYR